MKFLFVEYHKLCNMGSYRNNLVAILTSAASIFSLVICFLPLLLSWRLYVPNSFDSLGNTRTAQAIISSNFFISLVSSTSTCFHVLLHVIGHGLISSKKSLLQRDTKCKISNLAIFLIPILIQMLYVIPNKDYVAFMTIRYIRYHLCIITTLFHLRENGGKIWGSLFTFIACVSLNAGLLTGLYSSFSIYQCTSPILVTLSISFLCVGTILLGYSTFQWLRNIHLNIFNYNYKLNADEYFCNVYLIAFWLMNIGFWSIMSYFNFPQWYELDSAFLTAENVIFSMYYIVIAVFLGTSADIEVINSNVSHSFKCYLTIFHMT